MNKRPSAALIAFATSAICLVATVTFAQTKATPPKPMKPMKPPVVSAKKMLVQKGSVTVTDSGYQPARLTLKAGVPAQVTFVRKSEKTCGTEVVFPDFKIEKPLPLNKPVVVSFTPKKTGTYTFTCGMKMLKGAVVVK